MEHFNRITFNKNILGGKATIRDMRIPVSLILNLVANGMTNEEILKEYPDLEEEDISEIFHYAAWLAEESIHYVEAEG